MIATVKNVYTKNEGATLCESINDESSSIIVDDLEWFEQAGQVKIDDEIIDYSGINSGLSSLTGAVISEAHNAGDTVFKYPFVKNKYAEVEIAGLMQTVKVLSSLWGQVPDGERAEGEEESAVVVSRTLISFADVSAETSEKISSQPRNISFYIEGYGSVETDALAYIVGFNSLSISKVILSTKVDLGADLVIDINKNGTTIFTTQANRPKITNGNAYGESVAPNITNFIAGDRLTIDIDSGTYEDLAITIIGSG